MSARRMLRTMKMPARLELAVEHAVADARVKLGVGADTSLAQADNTYKIMILVGGGVAGAYFLTHGSPLIGLGVMGLALGVGGILEQSGKV